MKVARGQLVGSVVISAIVWLPSFLDSTFVIGPNGYPKRVPVLASDIFVVFATTFQSVFLYILPMLSLTVLSFLLIRGLNAAHKRRAALKGEEIRKAKDSFQISLMIAILMLMVLFNQAVIPLRRVLSIFYDSNNFLCGSVFFYYDAWIAVIQIITASMSFFLCLLTIKKYRRKMIGAFTRIRNQNSVAPSGASSRETYVNQN
jgi:hypothetical protein